MKNSTVFPVRKARKDSYKGKDRLPRGEVSFRLAKLEWRRMFNETTPLKDVVHIERFFPDTFDPNIR